MIFFPSALFGKAVAAPSTGDGPYSSTRWRINISAVASGVDWCSINKVEMRGTIGGADFCTGGTASASATQGGGLSFPSYAFDSNNSTQWKTGTATMPQWLEYTFASSVAIAEVVITAGSFNTTDAPKDFTIQYYDGSTWQTAKTVTGASFISTTDSLKFPIGSTYAASAADRWRIRIDAKQNSGNWTGVSELEFRASAGGADECSGGTAFASSSGGSNPVANAFDNNTGTSWLTGNTSLGGHVGYVLPTAKSIVQISMTSPSTANDSMTGFTVQYWNSESWATQWAETSIPTWSATQTRTFTKP